MKTRVRKMTRIMKYKNGVAFVARNTIASELTLVVRYRLIRVRLRSKNRKEQTAHA